MLAKSIISILLVAVFYGQTVEGQADDIRLRFYTGFNQWQLYDVTNLHTVIGHAAFSPARPTVFYHYGFTQTEDTENVLEIINAYNTVADSNFFLIYYLQTNTNTVGNARALGEGLGNAYIRLMDAGVNQNSLHLVGFSLGAQIQSIAARTIRSVTNNRLVAGRLTGIDPGQIQNILIPITGRVSAGDATYVDSIHTEGVGFGDHESRGHAWFMVNGGVAQPFCTAIVNLVAQTCSHNFAVTAWVESVRARAAVFPSLSCESWDLFTAGSCNSNQVGNMGRTTQTTLRGAFFLRTNNNSPFSRPVATP